MSSKYSVPTAFGLPSGPFPKWLAPYEAGCQILTSGSCLPPFFQQRFLEQPPCHQPDRITTRVRTPHIVFLVRLRPYPRLRIASLAPVPIFERRWRLRRYLTRLLPWPPARKGAERRSSIPQHPPTSPSIAETIFSTFRAISPSNPSFSPDDSRPAGLDARPAPSPDPLLPPSTRLLLASPHHTPVKPHHPRLDRPQPRWRTSTSPTRARR